MKEAKYLEEQKRQVEQRVKRWPRERTAAVRARGEGGTKPRSNAQFIRKVDQDE